MDAFTGRETPGHVLVLAGQLPTIAESRVRAMMLGGIQFLGWDTAQYARANQYDLIGALAAGLGGKSLPDDQRYPRPEAESEQSVVLAQTIAEFDPDDFMRRLATN